MIIAHEVTNEFSDRSLLSSMAAQAKDALATNELNVVADKGYYRSEELRACEEAGVTAYVPKPQTSNNQAKGLFGNVTSSTALNPMNTSARRASG